MVPAQNIIIPFPEFVLPNLSNLFIPEQDLISTFATLAGYDLRPSAGNGDCFYNSINVVLQALNASNDPAATGFMKLLNSAIPTDQSVEVISEALWTFTGSEVEDRLTPNESLTAKMVVTWVSMVEAHITVGLDASTIHIYMLKILVAKRIANLQQSECPSFVLDARETWEERKTSMIQDLMFLQKDADYFKIAWLIDAFKILGFRLDLRIHDFQFFGRNVKLSEQSTELSEQ